jgi:hypothetical protein
LAPPGHGAPGRRVGGLRRGPLRHDPGKAPVEPSDGENFEAYNAHFSVSWKPRRRPSGFSRINSERKVNQLRGGPQRSRRSRCIAEERGAPPSRRTPMP